MNWEIFNNGDPIANGNAIAIDGGNTALGYITNLSGSNFDFERTYPSSATIPVQLSGTQVSQLGTLSHIDREWVPLTGEIIKPKQ